MKNVAILGIGAIGGYIATLFQSRPDIKLHLLARSNFELIKTAGLMLTDVAISSKEPVAFHQFTVQQNMRAMPQCDLIIICVKSNQNSALLDDIKQLCHHDTKVITLQNGLDFEKEISQSLPEGAALYSGTCWIKVSKLSPNHIRHDFGTQIKLGKYSGRPVLNEQGLVALFKSLGLTLELTGNISSVQLTKLALNVPFYILSAETGKSVSEILIDAGLDKTRKELQAEIIQAAKVIGSPVDIPFLDRIIENLRTTSSTSPSSRDELVKRMSDELPQNAGALLTFFHARGVELPVLHEKYSIFNSSMSTPGL